MREDHSELHNQTQRQLRASNAVEKTAHKSTSKQPIDWNKWNPFERATGEALRQLNKREKKQTMPEGEEALL
jgi:hypothetical protein